MSKVLVDREMLERCVDRWACCAIVETPGAEQAWLELRAVVKAAQPAEAEGVEVRCDICGGTGAADSGGIQPWSEAIYVDCECIAKQEQFAGKLGALKKAAKGACSYSEEDWFRPENLWSCMEKDDAAFVSAASPFALLALIAAYERISAALSAVTAERGALKHALDVKEEFYQDALHSHIVLARQVNQLRAKLEALRPIHAMILNALDRDAEEGKTARGEMAAELRAAMAAKEA